MAEGSTRLSRKEPYEPGKGQQQQPQQQALPVPPTGPRPVSPGHHADPQSAETSAQPLLPPQPLLTSAGVASAARAAAWAAPQGRWNRGAPRAQLSS